MIFKHRTKHYLYLTSAEVALALRALLHFRNKALARGIDPVDIDGIIKRLITSPPVKREMPHTISGSTKIGHSMQKS